MSQQLQFNVKSLFAALSLVALAAMFARPYLQDYAPKWGSPTARLIDDHTAEFRYWTGRRHVFSVPRR